MLNNRIVIGLRYNIDKHIYIRQCFRGGEMEYNSTNDFYLIFKPVYNKDGKLTDYVLKYVSDSFCDAAGISPGLILGKCFSEIAVENSDKLGFKDLYMVMNPYSKLKYATYLDNLERWYIISIFNADQNHKGDLIIYYIDITHIKQGSRSRFVYSESFHNKLFHIKDRQKILYRDKLTGLYNKNFFEEELARLDTKRQLPISIIMGDINGLKLINDAFGHKMGDSILQKAAEIMTASFREEDIICRVGGDEFVVLLPKTSEETALEIIERVKYKCEFNPLDYIRVNISLGAATKESEDTDIYEVLKKAENKMYFKKLKESKEAKISMIKSLKSRLEKITYETKSHYERLKNLSMKMADILNLSNREKEELMLLCEFHDIGKIGVSKSILQKQGCLNEEEWEDIKRHSEIGYYIAKECRNASPVDELILLHHERWDGKGYPGLLKRDEIPVVARVFAIADAYDIMATGTPYKDPMSNKQALNEIKDKSGSQFDPNIVEIFIRIMGTQEQVV